MSFVLFAIDRGKFFGLLLAGLVGLVVGYFLFMVLRAFWIIFWDFKTNRELDQLAEEFALKRRQAAADAAQRLDNGCAHDFSDAGGALPPDACRLCGLERNKPAGDCDHVWRVVAGIVPSSKCERCQAEFSTVHEG